MTSNRDVKCIPHVLLWTLVFCQAVFSHSVGRREPRQCGDSWYIMNHQRCCGGRDVFDLYKQKCCIGTQSSVVADLEATCCDGQILRPHEICCQTSNGEIHLPVPKSRITHTECCLTYDIPTQKHIIKTYNNNTHYCDADGQITEILNTDQLRFLLFESLWETSVEVSADVIISRRKRASPNKPKLPSLFPKSNLNCLRGKKSDFLGEKLNCCGFKAFRPSLKTCCGGILHRLPTKDSLCCGDLAFAKGDERNPCLKTCNGVEYDVHTQLCCKGSVYKATSDKNDCCGHGTFNTDTQLCCAGTAVDRHIYSCCADTMPYSPALMKCDIKTGTVTLKQEQLRKQNWWNKVCRRTLDTLGDDTLSELIHPGMVKFQGRVDMCGIQINSNSITIPLKPAFAIDGADELSNCLHRQGLKLVITRQSTEKKACRLTKRLLKAYLSGKTLDLFVEKGKAECKKGRGGVVVVLEENDPALILMSRRLDRMMKEVWLSRGR